MVPIFIRAIESIVRRDLIAQVALLGGIGPAHLLAQGVHLGHQLVDLLLLTIDRTIEFVELVLGETGQRILWGAGFAPAP